MYQFCPLLPATECNIDKTCFVKTSFFRVFTHILLQSSQL